MSRWGQGEARIEQQIQAGELQFVRGGSANGEPWLAKAERTLGAAATLVDTDASSAITLAYDAARFAALAVLAQQGLRATTKGGHLAVDEALRAQFGDAFRPFKALRIRRNELEYPDIQTRSSSPPRPPTPLTTAEGSSTPRSSCFRTSACSELTAASDASAARRLPKATASPTVSVCHVRTELISRADELDTKNRAHSVPLLLRPDRRHGGLPLSPFLCALGLHCGATPHLSTQRVRTAETTPGRREPWPDQRGSQN
jgi:hypothetical protein